ncbi:MAG: type II secretion system protein E [Acidobacteria bacterium]|nr:MAG: type II secretion system protein E [Acidobacteriota bacterium]
MGAPPPSRKTGPVSVAPSAEPSVDILPILVTRKVLTGEQAERVRRATRMGGQSVAQAVIQLGFASEVQIAQALAAHVDLPYVKINPLDLDLDVVTKGIAGPFARKHGLVAIGKSANTITVAVHDPFAPFPAEDIARVTGLAVDRVVATRTDVETINKGFYDLKASLQTAEKQLTASRLSTVDLGNQEFLSGESKELDPAAAPVVKALDHILSYAFEQRASDIHFEPKRDLTLVRLRIDGILHDVHLIPKIVYQAVISRIKLLSGCNLAEKRRPQDGRIKRDQGGREIELRVSTMPTAFGEKAVLRIFDPDIMLKGIDELGLSAHDLPNIITIEDPIEMVFEDFNQVAVRPQIEITFASALRTVLRQDPDIIMVGEIRDTETAENAVQAALTGHLVLSTLHTNDAPSSITRLLDLGVPHFLITSTLIGILAQRLVRENCSHCILEYEPTAEEAAALRMPLDKLQAYRFKKGKGCLHCRETGYIGRTGIFEVMPMSERIRRLVSTQAGSLEVFKAAREEGMRTLREAGIEKVFRGTTTTTEVVRVTGK